MLLASRSMGHCQSSILGSPVHSRGFYNILYRIFVKKENFDQDINVPSESKNVEIKVSTPGLVMDLS